MSGLSGFDSEVVGFDNVSEQKKPSTATSAQTTEFSEHGSGTQTYTSKEVGCMAYPEDLNPGPRDQMTDLNAFLKRVVPEMMVQLDQTDREFATYSSDSDEEDQITAKLLQEIHIKDASGSGDHGTAVLGVSWSSAGNSIAISIGALQHETWCQNSGLIKVFTLKRSEEKFLHSFDVTEKNCVSVLKYHPTVAALLAYGTASGEVVLCNLAGGNMDEGVQLTSPSGCHGSRRVSALRWADASLVNTFLIMQINNKGKRRGASDQVFSSIYFTALLFLGNIFLSALYLQVLFSAGADGTLNAWQVNANSQVFENIVCYSINSSRNLAPDISCFDFIKNYPLRPTDEKIPEVFVVGTKTGTLFLCNIKCQGVDPVFEALEGHPTCVLDVAFSEHRPGIFVSISMDSELRVYDVNQPSPLKVC